MAELSDISFADPWLKELKDEKKGRTLLIQRKNHEIIDGSDSLCEIEPIPVSKVITSQIYNLYMKKKVYQRGNDLYRTVFPKIDIIDRLIALIYPHNLRIPRRLMLKYMAIYQVIVALKARRDFLR